MEVRIVELHKLNRELPDIQELKRLQGAVIRIRTLLNDPAALIRRASELLDGQAELLI